jgi:hypothetical protein
LFGFAWLYSFANAPNVRTSRAARFSTTGSPPVGDLALRFPRQLSGIDELHRRGPAQRQALLATFLLR